MAQKFIEIEGKRLLWRDVLKLRREQLRAAAAGAQPALFVLKDDCRPASERTAAGRYQEPSLFALLKNDKPRWHSVRVPKRNSRPSSASL
jgi:hypothetical protein